MRSAEISRRYNSIEPSKILPDLVAVTDAFYANNPTFTRVTTPKPSDLGLRWEEGITPPPKGTETIMAEMEALLPTAQFYLKDFVSFPLPKSIKNLRFTVGMVYAADPHTYLTAPADKIVAYYRQAFEEYLPHLPSSWQDLQRVKSAFPSGLPKGRMAEYLPLHAVVWCFMENEGKVLPIDALSLLSGDDAFQALFEELESSGVLSESDFQQLETQKRSLRKHVLSAMSEYSHVAAVGIFHVYEDYLMEYFLQTIRNNRETFSISSQWTEDQLRRCFSLVRKGIRRHMNIGYDPDESEPHAWFRAYDNPRTNEDRGRGPASQPSIHFFLREISFKKWCRLLRESLESEYKGGSFEEKDYLQLDKLVSLALKDAPGWKPRGKQKIFNYIARNEFLADDPARFIKALDPFANWEGPALLDLIYQPLQEILKPLGLIKIEQFDEPSDAMKPYSRNINAIRMQFPGWLPPVEVLLLFGDILKELSQIKKATILGKPVPSGVLLTQQEKISAWQAKMLAYKPSRKQSGDTRDYSYDLGLTPTLFVRELSNRYTSSDQSRILGSFLARLLLYSKNSSANSLEEIIAGGDFSASPTLQKIVNIVSCASSDPELAQPLSRAFKKLNRRCRRESGITEECLARYLVVKTLENERMGLRPKGQRPLNSTRLPGLLYSFDYVRADAHSEEYLFCTISPIISERGSMEQIKGLLVDRTLDTNGTK